MSDLNYDILERIASHLDPSLNVCLTSKLFYNRAKINQKKTQTYNAFIYNSKGNNPFQKANGVLTQLKECDIDPIWLWDQIPEESDNLKILVVENVVRNRNMQFFRKFEDTTRKYHKEIKYFAAKYQWIEMLNFYKDLDGYDGFDNTITRFAAINGDLSLIKWAEELESDDIWNSLITSLAAKNGHMHIIKYMVENVFDWEWCQDTIPMAIKSGQSLKDIEWMYDHFCPWNEGVTTCAVLSNRYDILLMAKRRGLEICNDTMSGLFYGFCNPINKNEPMHIDEMKFWVDFCLDAGCDVSEELNVLWSLVGCGNIELLDWVVKKCFSPYWMEVDEDDDVLDSCVIHAIRKKNKDMVSWFMDRGVQWSYGMNYAVDEKDVDFARWATGLGFRSV